MADWKGGVREESLSHRGDAAVLMVGNFLSPHTGVRGVCEDLSERLSRRGWQVFTSSSRRGSLARGFDLVATTARRLPHIGLAHVELYSGRAFLWGEAVTGILRAARKPHVVTVHGGGLPAFARRRPIRVRRVLAGAAMVSAPSTFLQRELAGIRGDIRVIPNGLELARYRYRERSMPKPHLVWLRAMHQIYDPVLAVEVTGKLVRRFPEISLLMIGPDKKDGSLEEVRSTISRLGLQDRVMIQGGVPKSEVPEWLGGADIFVNTSRVDNAPVTLLEAMACGLCVVTSDAGGTPDLVRDGEAGLLIPVGDGEAMAGAIARVLGDSALASRLSQNARAAAKACDWTDIVPRWEKLYDQVMSGA